MYKKILSKVFFIRHWPKKYLALLALLLIGVIWFGYTRVSSGKEDIQTSQVKKQDIKSVVSASGTLEGKETANLRFSGGGKLASLNVKAGDLVEKGQVLAGLDTGQLSINLQQAENSLKDKQAAYQKVIDDIHLYQYGNGGFSNVGTSNETQTQRSTRIAAESAANNASDAVKSAKRAFSDTVLTSPMNGLITQVNYVAGQNVAPSETIIQVVDDSEIYFDAEVDEADIAKVSINQKAEITLNSYPDKVFKGFISEIIPHTKTTASGATVVVARVNLGQPGIKFIADTNGQASIIFEEKFNVLTIPIEALEDEKIVYTKEGNSYKKVEVEVGTYSDTDVEIKKGLSENQEVVTNPESVKAKVR
jgi:RND family efflux transporter MFP subunit